MLGGSGQNGGGGGYFGYWQTQPPIDWLDTSLVINTWETVAADLSGGEPCRLLIISVTQTNNGASPETIQLEITVDETAYAIEFLNVTSGTPNYLFLSMNLSGGDFLFGSTLSKVTVGAPNNFQYQAIPFDCAKVGLIRVRQTTTVDAVSAQIEVNIAWEKMVSV